MFGNISPSNPSRSPKFDIEKKSVSSVITRTDSIILPEIVSKTHAARVWSPDAKLQISSLQWLKKFGLKAKNLDSITLFPKLGFARLEGYNKFLKKPVHSKYGENLFPQHFREDGLTFNVVAKKDRLLQTEEELNNAIELFQQRLEWLSTESRRLFGVIEEKSVTIILDIKPESRREFDQFICAIERLINEQIRHCLKFTFIRVQEPHLQLSSNLLPVTKENLATAIDWLWQIDLASKINTTNLVEALIRASNNKENEAIYLITKGTSSDGSREVLREKVKQLQIPFNIVAYNCNNKEFLDYLYCLTSITGGRFHTYSFNIQLDSYETSPVDNENPKANLLLKKKVYGGSVGGIGTRSDCVAVFSEIEEARVVLYQIKNLINQIPDKKSSYDDYYHKNHPLRIWNYSYRKGELKSCCSVREPHKCRYCLDETQCDKNVERTTKEEYMSSVEWLNRFGLKPQKLDFYDVLSGVCFRHCDGVVNVLEPPPSDKIDFMEQQNATNHQKLINAKYCDKFAHVKWRDGSLVHVQMPPDVHRLYCERMKYCLSAINRRIEWLRQGSREVFGTIMEDRVYILIDTSSSMEPHIEFVKDKLYTLIQEQLRHKTQINFLAFNSKAVPWRDRLVDVTEENVKSAWHWLEGLQCQGSTNTLAALQFAVRDRNVQGIYLLTDGRPDQPPKMILSQIQLQHRLPIHTISFNCADLEANTFLYELARETGGRFHYFNEISGGADCTNENGLEAWESEDIRLLKAEYREGSDNLEKVTKLRDECQKLSWKKEIEIKKDQKNIRKTMIPGCNENFKKIRNIPKRASSRNKSIRARNTFQKEKEALNPCTFNSFFEALSSRKENEDDWVLDETQDIIDRQAERYRNIMQNECKEKMMNLPEKPKVHVVKPRNLDLNQWFQIYGLVPQHMTILDALAPTIIKIKPKYIPIINRSVISKVFEEIFPISHVVTEGSPSTGYRPVVRLVNPLAVDLKGYQDRLEILLNKYKKKLRQLIKDKLGENVLNEFDNMLLETPMGNDDVKLWVMKSFENEDWPICEEDLEMFLKEIYIGHKYFIQAGGLLRLQRNYEKDKNKPDRNEIAEFEVGIPIETQKSKQLSTLNNANNNNNKSKSKKPNKIVK